MSAVGVDELLKDIASEWSELHEQPLVEDWREAGNARVTGDPALRQAVLSLLENAREAHSPSLELAATIEGSEVAIAVRDRGDGFSEEMLAEVGHPFRSGKGQGRGIGLFLAATVARRLGGRLDAVNRQGGGAIVAIRLPIVGR